MTPTAEPEVSAEIAHASAKQVALTILENQAQLGQDEVDTAVRGAVAATSAIHPDVELDQDRLRREVEELVTVFVGDQSTLADNTDHVPWLDSERASIGWKFWERYRRYLTSEGLPPNAVRRLDEISDDILGRLESPRREGAWDRRGMVAGQVQSGKTSNYLGLVCKAADAGYRVIVVLAGMHDSLRSQTQHRVDEGFLGFDSRNTLQFNDSERNRRIGAGALFENAKLIPVFSYTSSLPKGDFNRNVASTISGHVGSDPVVLVVKKNKTILENLISWATTAKVRDPASGRSVVVGQPLLVIDDEADNASVNTKEVEREVDERGELLSETDPTAINRLIRRLLHSFQQSAYVGYTATPFANIFIWEDETHSQYGEDLFPRSFIVRIPPPSNYVGPAQVFGVTPAGVEDAEGAKALPIIRHIDDHEEFVPDRHRKTLEIGPMPPSLTEAIRAFVLTCASRRARGQGREHNSMLIHVTRFVDVQEQVVEAVKEVVDGMRRRLRAGEGASRDTLVSQLRELWERDYRPTSALFDESERGRTLQWRSVEAQLLEAVSRINVMKINGTSADALAYTDNPEGLSVIAVGGDKLSRGLTLEGLSVSYYLRASRMYDTLMQMGRWFGYRPGYLDLCRLYTTSELEDWYRDITVANEELLEEFDAMAAAGGTPRDYGLRVRKHPAGLLITARAKMRNGKELELDYSGYGIPTTAFSLKREDHEANLGLVGKFLSHETEEGRLSRKRGDRGAHLWRAVPGVDVAQMLSAYRVSERSRRADGRLLGRYIETAVSAGELTDWTVALVTRREKEGDGKKLAGLPIGLIERAPRRDRRGKIKVTDAYSVGQLLSGPDEWLDLSSNERDLAKKITAERFEAGEIKTKSGDAPEIDGIGARWARPKDRGLLVLYPLDPEPASELGMPMSDPLLGFYVSFPRSETSRPIKYQVNNVFWQMDLGLE